MSGRRPREKAVLIYDGDCPLCLRSIDWVRRLDRLGRVEMLSLTREWEVGDRFPRLVQEDLRREMHLVDSRGRVWRGFDAVRLLARLLPPLWPLWPLLHLPGLPPVGRALYRRIAASRGREGEPCEAHRPPGSPQR